MESNTCRHNGNDDALTSQRYSKNHPRRYMDNPVTYYQMTIKYVLDWEINLAFLIEKDLAHSLTFHKLFNVSQETQGPFKADTVSPFLF